MLAQNFSRLQVFSTHLHCHSNLIFESIFGDLHSGPVRLSAKRTSDRRLQFAIEESVNSSKTQTVRSADGKLHSVPSQVLRASFDVSRRSFSGNLALKHAIVRRLTVLSMRARQTPMILTLSLILQLNPDTMTQFPALQPYDQFNRKLEGNVHPSDWVNPEPQKKYHLVVIGAGTAGLVTAIGAAGLGAKVALIERELMGGDCLNVGCVPSKALIAAARTIAHLRQPSEFFEDVAPPKVDFAAVMERMRKVRSEISHHDSAKKFADAGVDVFLGDGKFVDSSHVVVGDQKLKFRRAVIATGARAALPSIPGLDQVDVLTNETLFSLTTLPPRLLVIGGGPIGTEMAQTFARLGSQVTLIEKADHILSREDSDAARLVQASLVKDGVNVLTNAAIEEVLQDESEKRIVVRRNGQTEQYSAEHVLVGIGRAPNVNELGLETVGVKYDLRKGVEVDDRLCTANKKIFAAGDVCSRYKFTHAADFMARTVIRNAVFSGRAKLSSLTIPWATYTSPELAQVGLNENDASENGVEIDTWIQPFSGVDRAILEGDEEGFVKIHTRNGTDQIVGATIVCENAGDMISEVTLAMTQGVGLGKIANVIHPYPTTADAIRKLGDQYNRTRLTPFVQKLFGMWLKVTG